MLTQSCWPWPTAPARFGLPISGQIAWRVGANNEAPLPSYVRIGGKPRSRSHSARNEKSTCCPSNEA